MDGCKLSDPTGIREEWGILDPELEPPDDFAPVQYLNIAFELCWKNFQQVLDGFPKNRDIYQSAAHSLWALKAIRAVASGLAYIHRKGMFDYISVIDYSANHTSYTLAMENS